MGINYSKPDYITFECPHCILVRDGVLKGLLLPVQSYEVSWREEPKFIVQIDHETLDIPSFNAIPVDVKKMDELGVEWRERNIREIMEEMNMIENRKLQLPSKSYDFLISTD